MTCKSEYLTTEIFTDSLLEPLLSLYQAKSSLLDDSFGHFTGINKSFLVLHSPRDFFPSYLSQRIGHVAVAPHRHKNEARRLSMRMAVEEKTAFAELVSDTGAALKT